MITNIVYGVITAFFRISDIGQKNIAKNNR